MSDRRTPTVTSTTPRAQLPEHLTVEEYAAVMRCSTGAIYEAIRQGAIPARRVGRLLRIPREALS